MGEREVADYVVVGAGSAGSVVVRRLLDSGHSVSLIEAGPTITPSVTHGKTNARR
jgi:choline dehydrogenase